MGWNSIHFLNYRVLSSFPVAASLDSRGVGKPSFVVFELNEWVLAISLGEVCGFSIDILLDIFFPI